VLCCSGYPSAKRSIERRGLPGEAEAAASVVPIPKAQQIFLADSLSELFVNLLICKLLTRHCGCGLAYAICPAASYSGSLQEIWRSDCHNVRQ
jgi:hypothetical protein